MNLIAQLRQLFTNLFQWWIIVAPWEQAVRVRLGRHTKLLAPGIHLKLPIADMVFVQPIRLRAHFLRSQTLTTSDGRSLMIAASIQYQITDLLQLYSTLHNAHDVAEQRSQAAVARLISGNPSSALDVRELPEHIMSNIDLSAYGMKIRGVSITEFAYVKGYRLISGQAGHFTGYDQRLETSKAVGQQ